jgi:hypothetical protein
MLCCRWLLHAAAQVEGDERLLLVAATDGYPFVVESMGDDEPPATCSADLEASIACSVGPLVWALQPCAPTKRSHNDGGDPVYLFSMVDEERPERVFCVVLRKGGQRGCSRGALKAQHKAAARRPCLTTDERPSLMHSQP